MACRDLINACCTNLKYPVNQQLLFPYCDDAVESIQFLDAQRVVIVSDKSKNTQPHNCMHKDLSISMMALPKYSRDDDKRSV
jgi:hypothetical protein